MINVMKRFMIFILMLQLLTTSVAFAQEYNPNESFEIIGKIKHFSYEGGFYGIEADNGAEYKPINLTSSFKIEGLRVRARARFIKGGSFWQSWGVPIEIIEIERYRE